MNTNDIEDLVSEFAITPFETILQNHFVNGAASGLRIQSILAVEMYISKYDFINALRK